MTVHVLHAGDGYRYLTDSVATHDVARAPGSELVDYYTAEGNTPGRWQGSGMAGLGVGGEVSEAQMRALFGEGLHPEADAIIAEQVAGGASEAEAVQSARLGRKYPQHSTEREDRWRETLAAETAATAAKVGVNESALGADQKDAARLRAGTKLFHRLRGRAPVDERELRQFTAQQAKPTPQAVAGYDLVFTPVKSVSVVWALADHDTRREIEAAHEAAVARTVEFLESEAAFTRTGEAGAAQENTCGLVIAAFDHRDSRGGDPNLHTHCAVSNKVQGLDGKWRSLDSRAIHYAGVAASETYNTTIEDELRTRLGVDFTDVSRGDGRRPVREIVGVDQRLVTGFSSRRDAITGRYEQLLADYRSRHGKSVPKSVQYQLAQQATLDTREGKTEVKSLAEQRIEWRARAAEMVGEASVDGLGAAVSGHGIDTGRQAGDVDIDSEAGAVVSAVSADRCRWRITHLRAETQRRLRDVRVSGRAEREALVEAVTQAAQARSIMISAPDFEETPAELTRADGVSVFRKHGADWLSSQAVMEAETRLLSATEKHVKSRLDESVFDAVVAAYEDNAGRELDTGQRELARQFACSPAQVAVGVGPAGAGKTAAMAALAHVVQAGGNKVIALAPSANAAALLGAEIGADSSETLAATLLRANNAGADAGFGAGDVLVVDEASMASTFDLDALAQVAGQRGARVRLLGDHMQLAAVEAGGAFRLLAETTGAVELAELHRFAHQAEAEATGLLRAGDETGLDFYETHERIHAGAADELADRVYAAWQADQQAGVQALMVAGQSATVAELNARARLDRVTAGLVNPHGVKLVDGTTAGAGDVIVTRCNERALTAGASGFVKNGDLWHVEATGGDGSLTVTHREHRGQVRLPGEYVAAHVELGYATTIHRAQGITVDACHVLIEPSMARQGLYVALTRGRQANHAYVPVDITLDVDMHTPPEPVEPTSRDILAAILARDSADVSAHQTIADELEAAESLATLVPEYEHALDIRSSGDMAAVVHEIFTPDGSQEAPLEGDDTVDTADSSNSSEAGQDERLIAAIQAAWQYYTSCRDTGWVPEYLHQRGFENLDGFGYAPAGWTHLVDHLREAGFSDDEIIDAGLAKRSRRGRVYDRFRDRLVQPIHNTDGTLVAFTGRANPAEQDAKTPKYLNSPASRLYDKSSVLIGLAENHAALAAGAVPVIAEGPLDAAAITHATGGAAIGLAPGGTALTRDHATALANICDLATTPVVVATDSDEAGQTAAEACWHKLTDAGAVNLRAAGFGQAASDPGELLQTSGPQALAEAVNPSNTQPLVDTVVDRRINTWANVLDHINGRFAALDEVASIVSCLPAEQQPAAMIGAATRLDVDAGAAAEYLAEANHTRQQAQHTSKTGQDNHAAETDERSRAEQILDDPAWPGLERRLARLQGAGHDPTVALRQAAGQDFTGATSITRVLAARLDKQHQPTPAIPVAPLEADPDDKLGTWLSHRYQRIQNRTATLAANLNTDPPEWARANYAIGDKPAEVAALAQAAIYRDRYHITDTSQPLGYEPEHPGQQRRQWHHLKRRLTELTTAETSTSRPDEATPSPAQAQAVAGGHQTEAARAPTVEHFMDKVDQRLADLRNQPHTEPAAEHDTSHSDQTATTTPEADLEAIRKRVAATSRAMQQPSQPTPQQNRGQTPAGDDTVEQRVAKLRDEPDTDPTTGSDDDQTGSAESNRAEQVQPSGRTNAENWEILKEQVQKLKNKVSEPEQPRTQQQPPHRRKPHQQPERPAGGSPGHDLDR